MRLRPDYYYTQSAVIPYRWKDGAIEILMITSRRRRRWIVPKGIAEAYLTPAASAAKEAWEEAGIEGIVAPDPIGEYRYVKWGDTCTVTVFTMEVTQVYAEWPESDRLRRWVPLKRAVRAVEEQELKAMLDLLPDFLARTASAPDDGTEAGLDSADQG